MRKGEYIFEFYPIGTSVKVTAICVETGIEAVIIVPIITTKEIMQEMALKKLAYVKNKDNLN